VAPGISVVSSPGIAPTSSSSSSSSSVASAVPASSYFFSSSSTSSPTIGVRRKRKLTQKQRRAIQARRRGGVVRRRGAAATTRGWPSKRVPGGRIVRNPTTGKSTFIEGAGDEDVYQPVEGDIEATADAIDEAASGGSTELAPTSGGFSLFGLSTGASVAVIVAAFALLLGGGGAIYAVAKGKKGRS
jgi:hypothetical protein